MTGLLLISFKCCCTARSMLTSVIWHSAQFDIPQIQISANTLLAAHDVTWIVVWFAYVEISCRSSVYSAGLSNCSPGTTCQQSKLKFSVDLQLNGWLVVRTSVYDWRTFPDLCLIYGWHVTTLWVMCLLWVNQRGQLDLPSLWRQ